ncbi:ABC-type dipeptide/oligopeptide/nickel transport system ATPase subunit [Oxalobacteraceae bacterium GrIS 2.11]
MKLDIQIKNIQHIDSLSFSIDISKNKLVGIVGRNGVGKTTLIKALQNLHSADTFKRTSSDSIFRPDSEIKYAIDETEITFSFDPMIGSLNSKQHISDEIRSLIDVELPLPFGQRFNFYQSISSADSEIRKAIVLQDYRIPHELIEFMNDIYDSKKFKNLVEVRFKKTSCYCITLEDNRYIREDYLSSGEYFLINLYRKIQSRCKLIVIDEIDISLDAAAQVHLVRKLRDFCGQYGVNILFSTHSLAMMQTLEDGELHQMRCEDGIVRVVAESYAYIKSTLYGFVGWDRYILTEDILLVRFLEYIIKRYDVNAFYEYKIIYVGAAGSVVDLMRRNSQEKFLSEGENVISILDGDQKLEKYARKPNVFFIPIESIEKELFRFYEDKRLPSLGGYETKDPKKLFKKFVESRVLSATNIFEIICVENDRELSEFAVRLGDFLSPAAASD